MGIRRRDNSAIKLGTIAISVFLLQIFWIAGCGSSAPQANSLLTTANPLAPIASIPVTGVVSGTQNPQVARYTIVPPRSGMVTIEFGPDTNYGLQTATGRQVSVLVAGMRAYTTYHMRARIDFDDGSQMFDSDHTFTTGGLPPTRVPQVTVTQPAGFQPNPGIELVDIVSLAALPQTSSVTAAAFDLRGNLIWFNDLQDGTQLDSPFPIKLLPNGNFLLVYHGASNGVREINLAGETVSQLSLETLQAALSRSGSQLVLSELHHDILPLLNGHWILLANTTKTFTDLPGNPGDTDVFGDVLIDLDEHRNPVWVWSTFDHLDINRHPLAFPDWTHSNAVIYSPDDGNLILSMRHQNWVVKIDYRDGRGDGSILWRLGPGGDFVILGNNPADYNYAQHYPVLTGSKSSGVFPLMLFDNGNNRVVDSSGNICGSPAVPCYSRPVVFQLDETAKTAQILWQYELPSFSVCCGSTNILQNGNAEFDIAAFLVAPFSSRIQEVTQEVAPQLVWQMDVQGQLAYRAFRIPSLYPGVEWRDMPQVKP